MPADDHGRRRAGPFHNDSESYYVARKPLEIDMDGISVWPVEVGVENQTQLRGVETPLDGIPLIGSVRQAGRRSQTEQSKSAAAREVKQKVAAQARQRVDAEARQRLTEVVDRMNQRVFDPLNSLSLDPQMIDAETTEKRFTMRLRLAGEDQLGSHTPRPQAPGRQPGQRADPRIGAQQRHPAAATRRPHVHAARAVAAHCQPAEPPGALGNQPRTRRRENHLRRQRTRWSCDCQDGQIMLTLSIAQLSKAPRKMEELPDSGVLPAGGRRPFGRTGARGRDPSDRPALNFGSQIALRGIFSRALSKNNAWDLVPEQIVKEPKLSDAAITQFVIDDGWIGVALGPKRPAAIDRPQAALGLR